MKKNLAAALFVLASIAISIFSPSLGFASDFHSTDEAQTSYSSPSSSDDEIFLKWVSMDHPLLASLHQATSETKAFCRGPRDCGPGLFCVQGTCQRRPFPGCNSIVDCAPGSQCVGGRCLP